jgi:hypothetical protein
LIELPFPATSTLVFVFSPVRPGVRGDSAVNYLRRNHSGSVGVTGTILERTALREQAFHRVISLEQRRAERSGKSFLLMLVDISQRLLDKSNSQVASERILAALMPMTRETDIIGWYEEGSVSGVLFTEIAIDDLTSTTTAIMNRVSKTLKNHLTAQQFSRVNLSFHLLPAERDRKSSPVEAPSVDLPGIAAPSFAVELQ